MDEEVLKTYSRYSISDPSHVGEARRMTRAMATEIGLGSSDAEKVAIITTEAANNIIRYGKSGSIMAKVLSGDENSGLEIMALDHGNGMVSPSQCLVDGYSTSGTAGTGLGAIKRLSHQFTLFSTPQKGTLLLSQVWSRTPTPEQALNTAAVAVPFPGEKVCGDSWAVEVSGERTLFLVADGLGHGPQANESAREAVATFRRNRDLPLPQMLSRIHEALRKTRGAAVAISELVAKEAQVRFVGVGNISACVLTAGHSQSMVSHNGTAGQEMRKIQQFGYDWTADSILIMHSDGINNRWDLAQYPGLWCQSPSIIAGVIYRDFTRGRDDATVLVHKAKRWSSS